MKIIINSLRISIVFMVLCGLIYNLAINGIAQVLMPDQADGSLIYNENGQIVGSKLIGQTFTDAGWFHGRISSIDYQAAGSGTPNYAPSNPDMLARMQQSAEDWGANNPAVPIADVPIDLISNSGSGLDPHISPDAAKVQIPRISSETGLSVAELETLVEKHIAPREWGIFGEPTVNVLQLNIALQQLKAS
ncbi:potassium-transporting ATPase subunit KdpC [Paenibacillus sp. strain BS8-2]